MKAVMLMFDSLNREMLEPYGCDWVKTPNFRRLAEHSVCFDRVMQAAFHVCRLEGNSRQEDIICCTEAGDRWSLLMIPCRNF